MVTVAALYRVAWGVDPLAWPEWDRLRALPFAERGRFDDPLDRFRVLYAAEQRRGCYAEVLARFRLPVETLAALQAIADADDAPTTRVALPPTWRAARRIGRLYLAPGQRWLDLADIATIQRLRGDLAPTLVRLGLGQEDFDVSKTTGPHRALTQAIAGLAYEQGFQGLCYGSRHGQSLECWAIFENATFSPGPVETIEADDPDLRAIADLYGIDLA